MRIDYKKYSFCNSLVETKIVHISDIHFSKSYNLKRLDYVIEKIRYINPNYICITGDLIDYYNVTKLSIFQYFISWLKELSNICMVIISIGNHEYMNIVNKKTYINNDISWLKNLANDNLKVLDNSKFTCNGITFIGYNPSFMYYKEKEKNNSINNKELSNLLCDIDNTYNILLVHTPYIIFSRNNYKNINNISNVNLILCGHTHGGMVPSFFPGNLGLISPYKKLFPRKVRGKIKIGDSFVIISSGIVKLSHKSKLEKCNDIYGININEINIFTKNK